MKKNLKSTNIRSIIIIIQIQNMNIKLNMKDINKILAKAHLKYKYFKKWCEKNPYFYGIISLWSWWKSPRHAFTSPSCSLREKSSLPVFRKCGEPRFTAENCWQEKKNCYKPTSGYLNTASKFSVLFMSCLDQKKKICVFTVTRPTLIFASDPMHFYTEFG